MLLDRRSFIGVCGLKTANEYYGLAELARQFLPKDYFLMAGIKKNNDDLSKIKLVDQVKPFIHCDFNHQYSFNKIVQHNIEQTAGIACGLQLNLLPWLEIDISPYLKNLKSRQPNLLIILQAHRHIIENNSPKRIAERLTTLPVDYILFDSSQSKGQAFDVKIMKKYLSAVNSLNPTVGLVVAGGLGGDDTKRLLMPLSKQFSGLSCDAFANLQDAASKTLNWPKVKQYVIDCSASLD